MTKFKLRIRYRGVKRTPIVRTAVARAVRRWRDIIKGWKDGRNGYRIRELVVFIVPLTAGSGPGGTVAFTDPRKLRRSPRSAGPIAFLPRQATIAIDLHDVDALSSTSQLSNVFTHEIGHALGLGTIWRERRLVNLRNPKNPIYTGRKAIEQYRTMAGRNALSSVPLERRGDVHSRACHWRQHVFPREILTAETARDMWISKLTVAALEDLGYVVDLNQADFYRLP